jgi:hypothetical protein
VMAEMLHVISKLVMSVQLLVHLNATWSVAMVLQKTRNNVMMTT